MAVLAGLVLAVFLAGRRGIDRSQALRFGILVLFVGLLGTKLFLLARLAFTGQAISMNSILHAGGGFYYGLIPGIVFAWWYIRHTRLPILSTLDAFSPSVALGVAIARVGCYAAGCCYGKPLELSSNAFVAYAFLQPSAATHLPVPLHPTQLYESAAAFLIFFFLVRQSQRNRFEGQVFSLMLILLAAARFVVEIFRGDAVRGFVIQGWLSVPQVVSLLLILAGTGLLLWLKRSNQREHAK